MSTLAAARADNFYIPQWMDPQKNHKSGKKATHNQPYKGKRAPQTQRESSDSRKNRRNPSEGQSERTQMNSNWDSSSRKNSKNNSKANEANGAFEPPLQFTSKNTHFQPPNKIRAAFEPKDKQITVRFEVPFPVRCSSCKSMLDKGVRFNADKAHGKFHHFGELIPL